MFSHLQIVDRRERLLVGVADTVLRAGAAVIRRPTGVASAYGGKSAAAAASRRILVLRLERIGDLLMSLDAIADVVRAAPSAEVDLVVGRWNRDLAGAIPGIARVETLDPSWLARDGSGAGMRELLRYAREWRQRRYDLALNFEPDIRSNLLLARSGAAVTAGFIGGGGGPLLDIALGYDVSRPTIENTRRLAAAVLDVPPRTAPARLNLASEARRRATELLATGRRPMIGVHTSGGRAIKQWPPERFGEVASRLAAEQHATIVLTGSVADRSIVDVVRRALPAGAAIDLAGALDLPELAAVIEQLDLYVTGDTGPMHVAAAVGTPIVAVFGPSDPARYAPPGPMHRIVRVDLPCAPCNRIRHPPARCRGHVPDCLHGIGVEAVYRTAVDALAARDRRARIGAG